MNEIPQFFLNDKQRLFGVLHQPEQASTTEGWVLCHAFAEEKLWAHRVYVNLARKLAEQGYPVLRFDYRGYGDSEGNFEDAGVDDHISDIGCAIGRLLEQVPELQSVGLLGLRYGATLAALAAEQDHHVSRLVMWDPLTNMQDYMQEVLRANLTTQMIMHGKVITNRTELTRQLLDGEPVNVDGYDLTRHFYQQASEINLLEHPVNFQGGCQIVQIGRANQPLKKNIEALAALYPGSAVDRVVEQPFWKEIRDFVQHSDSLTNSLFTWMDESNNE